MITTTTRRLVYVLNPAAGQGRYLPDARLAAEKHRADLVHLTEGIGDCTDFIAEACLKDPHTHFVVYGGDGTAGEAATGIMRAGAGDAARLTIMPCGSGNDFYRGISEVTLPEGEDSIMIDLLSVNGRHALNMMNIGFDCSVVVASESLRRKRFMSNGLSYICGVGQVLTHKESFRADIRLCGVKKPGESEEREETISGDFLLCAVGNLPYYGGGFKAAPAASPTDGLLDVMIVRNVSVPKFLTLVGTYRSGKHINPETLAPHPRFLPYIEYRQCRSLSFFGAKQVCMDGEVIPATGVRAEVIPQAIRYVPMKK